MAAAPAAAAQVRKAGTTTAPTTTPKPISAAITMSLWAEIQSTNPEIAGSRVLVKNPARVARTGSRYPPICSWNSPNWIFALAIRPAAESAAVDACPLNVVARFPMI